DGQLYAWNLHEVRDTDIRSIRWNPDQSRWEPATERTLLKFVHLTGGMRSLMVFLGFLITLGFCASLRLRRWFRGPACVWGTACLLCLALQVVPITSDSGPLVGVAISPDGSAIATTSRIGDDFFVCVWSASNGAGLDKIDFGKESIDSVEFRPE